VSRARGFCAATRTLYTVSVGQPLFSLCGLYAAKGCQRAGGYLLNFLFWDFETFLYFFVFFDKNTVQFFFCMVLFF